LPPIVLYNIFFAMCLSQVAERSKARVCGRSLSEVAGSNHAGVSWISVSCDCVLSARGLCDGPIPHPADCYRLWCIIVCEIEISRVRRPWPA
jgi:hypothetical protein